MQRFWIIENGRIIFIRLIDPKDKTESEQKIEIHRAIIQALKEIGEE